MTTERQRRVELLAFQRTLTPLLGVRIYDTSPFTGRIVAVTVHWPADCTNMVGVAVWHGNTRLCPREGYLAYENSPVTYAFNEEVRQAEEVWVDMRNGDTVNTYTVAVTVKVQEA